MKLCAVVLRNVSSMQSIVTHRTCQFWSHSGPVIIPKPILSRQMWNACCNKIPLFRKSDEECSQVLSLSMTVFSRKLQLQQRGSWSVFNEKCLITHHHPPRLGSCDFNFFPRMKRSSEGNILTQWAADQRRELTESTGGWLLWREYWKIVTTLQKMCTSERRLFREVAGRCG